MGSGIDGVIDGAALLLLTAHFARMKPIVTNSPPFSAVVKTAGKFHGFTFILFPHHLHLCKEIGDCSILLAIDTTS